MCHIWVNAAKSLVVSSICSRAIHLKPLLSRPSAVIFSFWVGLPRVQSLNCHILWFTLKLCYLFRVTDGGYIKALLWWVLFRRLQHIIRNQDLKIIQYLGACMTQWQVSSLSTVGFHYWPLIGRFRRVFDFSSFIHIRWIVLVYLGIHWH